MPSALGKRHLRCRIFGRSARESLIIGSCRCVTRSPAFLSWPRERTAIKLLDTQNLKLGKGLGCYPCTPLRYAGVHASILPSTLTWEYKRQQQKFLP